MDRDKLANRVYKAIKRKGIDLNAYPSFEWKDYLDVDISVKDNVEMVLEKLKIIDPKVSEIIGIDKGQMEKWQDQARQYYQEIEKERIKEIVKNKIDDLTPFYNDYYKHIESFLENQRVKGMVVVGKGGLGKSFNLYLKLSEMNKDYVVVKGHITPLSFYKTLYENRKSLVILDDVIKLISDKDIVNTLLEALDLDNKTVQWKTSRPTDVPSEFDFEGKIIILTNKFDGNNEFFQALKDRCNIYELTFDRETIKQMMYILANRKGYPKELVDHIIEFADENNLSLSLRILDRVYSYYSKENWQRLVDQILVNEENDYLQVIEELVNSGLSVKEQVKEWQNRTGLSRRTYFLYKKKWRKSKFYLKKCKSAIDLGYSLH